METLENYITALEQAYILYQAPQMGLGGKNLLNPLRKFYGVDTGLRNLAIGFAQRDMGFKLENVIFMELKRRGFQVFVSASIFKFANRSLTKGCLRGKRLLSTKWLTASRSTSSPLTGSIAV